MPKCVLPDDCPIGCPEVCIVARDRLLQKDRYKDERDKKLMKELGYFVTGVVMLTLMMILLG